MSTLGQSSVLSCRSVRSASYMMLWASGAATWLHYDLQNVKAPLTAMDQKDQSGTWPITSALAVQAILQLASCHACVAKLH